MTAFDAQKKRIMTTQVKITKVGNEFMLPLTAEILKEIGVAEGEAVSVSVESQTLIARSLNRVELEKKVDEIVLDLLEKRRSAYQILAEGA